jgi:hypothetical protein
LAKAEMNLLRKEEDRDRSEGADKSLIPEANSSLIDSFDILLLFPYEHYILPYDGREFLVWMPIPHFLGAFQHLNKVK